MKIFRTISKFIDLLVVISKLNTEMLEKARNAVEFYSYHEGFFYVYNPSKEKPTYLHTSFKEALKEARRISNKEKIDDIEVLKLVGKIPAQTDIPF